MEDRLVEAWRRRQHSLAHRLLRQLAGTGRGPKRREYRAAMSCRPSYSEWLATVPLSAGDGGMMGQVVDFEREVQRFEAEAPNLEPVDLRMIDRSHRDLDEMCWSFRLSQGRLFAPDWSAPKELWQIVLEPHHLTRASTLR